jgi:CubicO group peptidase (beta-lactamase class C family)
MAVLMQMMLQGGKYGGVELLDNETVSIFTQNQSGQSRRGWGWDKPERDPTKRSAVGQLAPLSTFGHTGFTGTAVWADPDNQLLYIFLSNRVHPSAGNNLITKEKIRGQIHDIIYKSFRKEFLLADN